MSWREREYWFLMASHLLVRGGWGLASNWIWTSYGSHGVTSGWETEREMYRISRKLNQAFFQCRSQTNGCTVSVCWVIFLSTWRPCPTFGLSRRSDQSQQENQWSWPMKLSILWFHRSAPLVSCSNWWDCWTESECGLGPWIVGSDLIAK